MSSDLEEDDLPEPEIETIRNFAQLPDRIKNSIGLGGLLVFDGPGVRENAIDLYAMSDVLSHFDRLVRAMRACRAGLEVKRTGRIADIRGARRLTALPSLPGSYALPLRLEEPDGELFGEDHDELEAVVDLLDKDEGQTAAALSDLPERVGDELLGLLKAMTAGRVAVQIESVRDGTATNSVTIGTESARRRSEWLEELVTSAPGVDVLRGKLFRIDTKRSRIAVDAYDESDDTKTVQEASFVPSQLEDLRSALNHVVEIEVDVTEERRRYERSARKRLMTVISVGSPLADD